MVVRRSQDRGHFDFDWLKTYHTFSFDQYYDARFTRFGDLRVINEDWVKPGSGFPTHSHRDMEIITYLLEGELEHKDSMGNVARIKAGEFQRMSAGSGVTHSEYNPSKTDTLHLMQIWIFPDTKNLKPSYEQKNFNPLIKKDSFRCVVSKDGQNGSLAIHQSAEIYVGRLSKAVATDFDVPKNRIVWAHVSRGRVRLDAEDLAAGDAMGIENKKKLSLVAQEESEVLMFCLKGSSDE